MTTNRSAGLLILAVVAEALVSPAHGARGDRAADDTKAIEPLPINSIPEAVSVRSKLPSYFNDTDDKGNTCEKKTCSKPSYESSCTESSANKCRKNLPRSCLEIKLARKTQKDGIYCLQTKNGQIYQAFCDMNTNGGGWTLVASVHENNIAAKCALGDRWSSQLGSNPTFPFVEGDKNWANRNVFNRVESATDTDYKNPGYFDLDANDISVWHVPNRTPLVLWKQLAILRYHTEVGFLEAFGGNLFSLYKNFYPLTFNTGTCLINNGPSYPIVYDYGTNSVVNSLICPNCLAETRPGFVQFRVFNTERAPFALCSGVMALKCNTEHYCIGGAGYVPEGSPRQCGDFSAFDWDGYGTQVNWSASKKLLESSVLIFYR